MKQLLCDDSKTSLVRTSGKLINGYENYVA
jgi:hypothetical protein